MNQDIVFLGPSLPLEEARAICQGAIFLPPVEQGELVSIALTLKPRSICLIDGLWSQSPAVFHRELLITLAAGIPIIGASSMGAIRAAECKPWGAIPCGEIARRFLTGEINDDEVVLAHADASLNWMPLSLPLINIRITLENMPPRYAYILDAARSLFYPERTPAALRKLCKSEDIDALQAHWIDQKAIDARAALHALHAGISLPPERKPSRYHEKCYGEVFLQHDFIVPVADSPPVRLYQVADTASEDITTAAIDRAIVLEYARSLGLQNHLPPTEIASANVARSWDLSPADANSFLADEAIIASARQFILHSDAGLGLVGYVNALLRSKDQWNDAKLHASLLL